MSTLPFLLSVADELDNINSQSYMDDFGLGFHPHRHYYRNPSIQLSLPASTEWMEERQRCRTHKFVDESQNNLERVDEGDADNDEDGDYYDDKNVDNDGNGRNRNNSATPGLNSNDDDNIDNSVQMYNLSKKCRKNYHSGAASTSSSSRRGQSTMAAYSDDSPRSSDECFQKVSSPIEFLTCFLVKKSRSSSKNSNSNSKKS